MWVWDLICTSHKSATISLPIGMVSYPDMMCGFRSRAKNVGPRQKSPGQPRDKNATEQQIPTFLAPGGKFCQFSSYRLELQIEKTLRAQDNHGWKIRLFGFFCERLCCDAYDLKKLALLNLKNWNNIVSHLTFKISNSIIFKRKNWKCLVV